MTALFDSWAWIEIFRKSNKVVKLRPYYDSGIVVSTINLFEVYNKLLAEQPESADDNIDLILGHTKVVWVSPDLALRAAEFKRKYKLGTADAIVLATAEQEKAVLVTGDSDFENVSEVEVEVI